MFRKNPLFIGIITLVATTVVYRKKALYPIYIFVMLTGLFSGFSSWWVPYLYIWLILWAVVMLLPQNIKPAIRPLAYMIVCALHGLLYGTLYAPVHMLLFGMSFKGMLAWIATGFPWDIVHSISNFFCGALICPIISAIKTGEKYAK